MRISCFLCIFASIMEQFDYRNAQRYAMQLGLVTSPFWSGSFLMCMYTFPSLLTDVGTLLGLSSLVFVGMKLRRLRRECGGVSVLRCLWLSWYTFMCTVLLTTAVQYIYFAFLDNGRMYARFESFFSSKEVEGLYTQMQMQDVLTQMQELVHQFGEVTVRELVMSFMSMNIMLGVLFSLMSLLFIVGVKQHPTSGQEG